MDYPICKDTRECFAKAKRKNECYCKALTKTYPDGECPFCKEKNVRNKVKN